MLTIEKLIKVIPKVDIVGNKIIIIKNALPLNEAGKGSITWIKDDSKEALKLIENTLASALVLSDKVKFDDKKYPDKVFIKTKTPKLTFIRIVKEFFVESINPHIHVSAIISKEAIIGKECFIGRNVIIGKCIIGKGTIINGNCFIYDKFCLNLKFRMCLI